MLADDGEAIGVAGSGGGVTAATQAHGEARAARFPDAASVQWASDGVLTRPPDIVLWRRLAVAGWITEAGRRGLRAEDVTYDVLDWRRDDDDSYAGTVRIRDNLLDLIGDGGIVRVCAEWRYDT